jgi:proliferating cell nuclear antigen
MLEARFSQAVILKKVVEAIRELVTDVNIDCTSAGLSLQSMDDAHVTLVMLQLKAGGFESYRCDRTIPIGINMSSLSKIIKCGNNEDTLTLKADDNGETLSINFRSPKGDKVSEYDLKLMDLDMEHLAVPDSVYDVTVRMSSTEFQRIVRDLQNISESVTISAIKDCLKFTAEGEIANGNIVVSQNAAGSEGEKVSTQIIMSQPASLGLSLKFLNMFAKATSLSDHVMLGLSDGVPMLVEYPIEDLGYLRFYLAPKVGDDDEMSK